MIHDEIVMNPLTNMTNAIIIEQLKMETTMTMNDDHDAIIVENTDNDNEWIMKFHNGRTNVTKTYTNFNRALFDARAKLNIRGRGIVHVKKSSSSDWTRASIDEIRDDSKLIQFTESIG